MTGSQRPSSFGSQWVHAGADSGVHCSTYPGEAPILALDTGRTSTNITVADRNDVDADAVRFARELAEAAQQFAAECERLYAAQQDSEKAVDAGQPGAGEGAAA